MDSISAQAGREAQQSQGIENSHHPAKQISRQGIVDGSASKPALRQDTGYMVETTYHDIAPYLGAFGAYLMPQ